MTSHERLTEAAKRYGWTESVMPSGGLIFRRYNILVRVWLNRAGSIRYSESHHANGGARIAIRGGVRAVINYMKFYGPSQASGPRPT